MADTSKTANIDSTLKNVGIDTDVMTGAAREKATELRDLVADELRRKPLQALGIAALIGFFIGVTR